MTSTTPLPSSPNPSSSLIDSVRQALLDLHRNPYPHIENPETCKKRASVALVIRIRPHFDHHKNTEAAQAQDAEAGSSSADPLEQFFAQKWVQEGDAEVVFIKRAARQGDRWTSHVALPGGKRDPEDADDKAVAIRETSEEIGLDLDSPDALFVGNLPERVVSTSWGKVPYDIDHAYFGFDRYNRTNYITESWFSVPLYFFGQSPICQLSTYSLEKLHPRTGCHSEFFSPRRCAHMNTSMYLIDLRDKEDQLSNPSLDPF